MQEDQAELLKIITSFLEKSKISYMITGAWSVIYYGRPRASHDIDFVVELKKEDTSKVLKAIDSLPEEFCAQKGAIEEAIKKRGMFNIFHLPTALKMDFWLLTDDEFDKSRFSRRKKVKILGQEMEIATAEDTTIQKLRWYQEAKIEKHLIDAAFVYQIQNKNLDKSYLKKWAKKLKIEKDYQALGKIDLEKYM